MVCACGTYICDYVCVVCGVVCACKWYVSMCVVHVGVCVVYVWCMCSMYIWCVSYIWCVCELCYHQNKVMGYSPIYDIIKVHVRVYLCVCTGRSAEAI